MYREIAEEEDKRMVERWQKDADGILIFVSSHLLAASQLRIFFPSPELSTPLSAPPTNKV